MKLSRKNMCDGKKRVLNIELRVTLFFKSQKEGKTAKDCSKK